MVRYSYPCGRCLFPTKIEKHVHAHARTKSTNCKNGNTSSLKLACSTYGEEADHIPIIEPAPTKYLLLVCVCFRDKCLVFHKRQVIYSILKNPRISISQQATGQTKFSAGHKCLIANLTNSPIKKKQTISQNETRLRAAFPEWLNQGSSLFLLINVSKTNHSQVVYKNER